jgi:hypothetical protein
MQYFKKHTLIYIQIFGVEIRAETPHIFHAIDKEYKNTFPFL